MARQTLDSNWTAIGGPGAGLAVRNISAETLEMVFAENEPPAELGDPVDLWSLFQNEGAILRPRQHALVLWARTASGNGADVDVFHHVTVVSGQGFYELDPIRDGADIELLTGGTFNETTEPHWTQSPANGATVTHAADGVTMTPASTDFADRAQVLQGFPTQANRTYTVTIKTAEVPSSDSCMVLIYDADGGLTLIESEDIMAAGEVTFDFVAASAQSEIHLRVFGIASPARFLSASVKGIP